MSPGITPRRSVRDHMHPRLDALQAFEWWGVARAAAATGPAEDQSVTLLILPSTLHDNQRFRSELRGLLLDSRREALRVLSRSMVLRRCRGGDVGGDALLES